MAKKRADPRHTGILLIDKPPGPTSHDVVGWVRWALRERTVGHCGTLDPPASGLLVVCVGEATKLVEQLTGADKVYRARLSLGRSTTTADAEGETLDEAEVTEDTLERARETLKTLMGPLELQPPAYSAIKVDGRRAHELARAGTLKELPRRPMAVHHLQLIGSGIEHGEAWLDVDFAVAKGTYIRSLAEELGRRVGCPAHMASLHRSACGILSLDDPSAVTGLRAYELPPLPARPGRRPPPPKWRVELPTDAVGEGEEEIRREQSGSYLRARLHEPWRNLPIPVSMVDETHGAGEGSTVLQAEGPRIRRLIERLTQGQRLALDPENCALLGLEPSPGPCALVHRGLQVMVLAARDRDREDHPRLAPSRILRLPACDPALTSRVKLPGGDG